MMESYICRAKRKHKGKKSSSGWVEGFPCTLPPPESWIEGFPEHLLKDRERVVLITSLEFKSYYTVDPKTVSRPTGKTDSNGQNIWEHDILFDGDETYFVVRWDEKSARFVLDSYGNKGCLMEYGFDETAGDFEVVDTDGFDAFYMEEFTIVSNIFDSPEFTSSGILEVSLNETSHMPKTR